MNDVEIFPAVYCDTGVSRFAGNPFIEALPPLEQSKDEFLTQLAHYPSRPSAALRSKSEVIRLMELSTINDIVYPFPEYQKAGFTLAKMARDTYVARHPLTVVDRQRRHAIATTGANGLPMPANWKHSAKGYFMMSISGQGKTTFAAAALLRYKQVICHSNYRGSDLKCHQIVYVLLRVPHDATLKSLCLQFFNEIDRLLGTDYSRKASALRNIAPMVDLMNKVATAVSLGFIVVDEVQNLRSARAQNADLVLNLFSEIIERLGISLLALATPAVQSVVEGAVRNTRKLASFGSLVIEPMARNSPLWEEFCDTYWDYTFVQKKAKLTKETLDAWYAASAGNTAFAALAFTLSQHNEIGGREVIDATAFQRTAATDMAFLGPAIAALLSKKPAKLRMFDDLLFSPKYKAMRALLGAEEPTRPKNSKNEEFDDVPEEAAPDEHAKKKKPKSSPQYIDLPVEDPLVR